MSCEKKGCQVIIAAKNTGKKQEIIKLGFEFVNINFDRKGLNPINEIKTFIQLYRVFEKIRPQFVYQVTIKPIIYGSILSKFLSINTVNTICGLGYVFSKKENSFLRKLVSKGYKNAVNYKKAYTFFENKDDQNIFLKLGILNKKQQSTIVNGVGVDLNKFKSKEFLNHDKKIVVTLASRMLWDKGVKEFIKAAKLLEIKFKRMVEFRLYGMIDKGNPESITKSYLHSIEIFDYLKWYGFVDNMVDVYAATDIIVLPSYREGLPTVLAEACAMSLPIVTTNAVGCKECVDEGVNGFKVSVKSISELADAVEKLVLNKDLRMRMGSQSRLKAEREFNQKNIVEKYEAVFTKMLVN